MPALPRRTILIGAAVAPIVACDTTSGVAIHLPASGQVLAATADIAVGSGKIVGDTAVTQPTPGVFKGFVARCTHVGCRLTVGPARSASPTDRTVDTLNCHCHGARFAVDGGVLRGPAVKPLTPVAVSVQGADIVAD